MLTCPADVECEECEFHRSETWCAQQYPKPRIVNDKYKHYMEGFWKGFNAAQEEYELLEKVLQEYAENGSAWIDVKDELPPNDELVIVSVADSSGDHICYYSTAGWHFDGHWIVDGERNGYVIGWQNFPKAYRRKNL